MTPNRRKMTAAALAALTAAGLATAALADRGPKGMMGGPAQMLIERFDAMDADKDGKVTEAELTVHRAAQFTQADANKDGLLDKAELAAFQMAMMQARAESRAAKMIERMDDSADGLLSADELAALSGPARGFDMMDTDNDGALTRDEVQKALTFMAEHRGGRGDLKGKRGHGWWGMGEGN